MAGEAVAENLCREKHRNIEKQQSVCERRMNNHSDAQHDVKEAIVRLTLIQEMQTTTQAAQTKTLEGIDRRVGELEEARVAHIKVMEQIKADEPAPKFWQDETGKWVIKVGVTLLAIVLLTAIGVNIGPELIGWLTGH